MYVIVSNIKSHNPVDQTSGSFRNDTAETLEEEEAVSFYVTTCET